MSSAWCPYLWLGWGQSDPYSWTCIPKKQTSTPSMSSNAKRAFVLYGNDSDISPLSTNLQKYRSQLRNTFCASLKSTALCVIYVDYNETKHTQHAFHTTYKGREKVPVRQRVPFSYLDFMPGLTSTTLSETWTTRMVTSPDSWWFWRFTKSFTRVSRKLPNFVCGNPVVEQCNRLLINVSWARHPLKTSVIC